MSVSADDLRSAADFLEMHEPPGYRADLVAVAKFLRQSADAKDHLAEVAAAAVPTADDVHDWVARTGSNPPTAADKSRGHGNIGAAK